MWCASRRPPLGVRLFLSLFAVSLRFSLRPSCHLAVAPFSSCSPLSLLPLSRRSPLSRSATPPPPAGILPPFCPSNQQKFLRDLQSRRWARRRRWVLFTLAVRWVSGGSQLLVSESRLVASERQPKQPSSCPDTPPTHDVPLLPVWPLTAGPRARLRRNLVTAVVTPVHRCDGCLSDRDKQASLRIASPPVASADAQLAESSLPSADRLRERAGAF